MKIYLVIAALVFVSVGCGKEEEKKTTDLEGVWTKACGTDDAADDENKSYNITTVTYAQNNITGTSQVYSDAACTVKIFGFRLAGTFVIGDSVTTLAGAKAIDTTPSVVFMTVNNADIVKSYNGESAGGTQKYCGGGFVLDVEKQLTTADCGDSQTKTSYDVFVLSGSSLTFGNADGAGVAESSDKRPTTLETRPYTKK